jgi:hypothetical protein
MGWLDSILALARRGANIEHAGILDGDISESPLECASSPDEEDVAQGVWGDML